MKIQVTTSEILTVYQLKKLIRELRGLEKTEHSGLEIEQRGAGRGERETADLVSNPQSQPFSVDIYVDDTNLCDCVISQ